MMLEMAAEKLWNDPHLLDHLTVGLGHSDAVAALSAGYGSATVTAHIGVQPFTDRGLKLPGAHVVGDSREVFGGPLTQVTLLATKQGPDLVQGRRQRVGGIDQGVQCGQARCRGALEKGSERVRKRRRAVCLLSDPGFELTSQPHRIACFAAFLKRIGTLKSKVGDWKELFWETAYNQQGD
jgi:NitT/TauT family transport system substrate-binding protein